MWVYVQHVRTRHKIITTKNITIVVENTKFVNARFSIVVPVLTFITVTCTHSACVVYISFVSQLLHNVRIHIKTQREKFLITI